MGFTAVGMIMGFHLASSEYPEISPLVGQAAEDVRKPRHIKGSTSFEVFSSPWPASGCLLITVRYNNLSKWLTPRCLSTYCEDSCWQLDYSLLPDPHPPEPEST